MASRLARLSTVLALAVATPCCCAFHAAPLLPRLHNRCRRSRTATMREPPDVARAIKEEEEECDIERLAAPWACNMDSIIDRAIDRATAETSQKNIINGRLGELKLGASDWMWIYRRWHGTWKPRPVWPASAAPAADWPRLAEAQGSLEHDLAPKEASGEPAGRGLSHLVFDDIGGTARCSS